MVMDQSLRGIYGSVNKLRINDETRAMLSNDSPLNQYARVLPPLPPNLAVPSSVGVGVNQVDCSHEDVDFSDVALKYISEMLMEEDMEEKACMYQESSAALQAAEQSLYELIGQRYPPSENYEASPHFDQNRESSGEISDLNYSSVTQFTFSAGGSGSRIAESAGNYEVSENRSSGYAFQSTSQTSFSSGSSAGTVGDGFADSPVSTLRIADIFGNSDSAMQFKKGFEEASRFIPNGSLFVDLGSNNFSARNPKEEAKNLVAKEEVKVEHSNGSFFNGSRGKKNSHPEDFGIEGGRSQKQSALSTESDLSSADFDMVLLSCARTDALRVELQNEKNKDAQQSGQVKGSTGGKARGKKQGSKRNVVDLRTLLTLCAQAVAADDRRSANDLLKQIRQNALPTGDGMQRLANIFADGLEARLAGSGTQIYKALLTKPTSAADVLKAYHLFLAACPFRKLTDFFSNKTIINISENATKLHIVDFGIMYGFQWPCLIRRLSSRPRPPMLRITGIDLPNPGFRPAERVEETGQRLANYAERFNVPFQFHAIAQKWDTIKIEDLKFDEDEVVVVNCEYRLRSLLDETVVVESPRNIVLNLIRKMNPDVFILGIVNGSYSAPFFITRFREALFHYSTLFDMLETNVPREKPERMLIEREIFGREAMNVIACEGAERIERPETYKQWQVRIQRAGFQHLPLNEEIFAEASGRVKALYHKDFVIDEDSQWLLQGWKGRIVYALSSWKPYR